MWQPTKEENDAWTARLVQLRASSSTEDRIVAVLMDSHFGGFGLREEIARRKVVEILLLRGLK